MKKFFIYYFYFSGILFTLNDERFLGVLSRFFLKSCQENPTNLYIFLISTAVILLGTITIPRFKAQGNELQVPFNQIQNLEINIIGLVPYYQMRFYYDIIANYISKFISGVPKKVFWEKQSRVVTFFMIAIVFVGLIFILIIAMPLALIFLWLFLLLSVAPLLSLLAIISIIYPQFFDFIHLSLLLNPNFEIVFNIIAGVFGIGSLALTGGYVILNRGYSRSREVQYSLDVENRILRSVIGPKEDIPLHTLSSFRRHPIYPTGIILNEGNLIDSPAIDWRIATNQGIGTTNELITYLNNLILEAKIQKEKERELVEKLSNALNEYLDANKENAITSIKKWVEENVKKEID
jgi:hypothetical protein